MGEFEVLVAGRLRAARAEAKLSQVALAARAGIGSHTLINMESGDREIALSALVAVAAVLGKPVTWFFGDGGGSVAEPRVALRSGRHDLPPEAIEEIVDLVRYILDKYELKP